MVFFISGNQYNCLITLVWPLSTARSCRGDGLITILVVKMITLITNHQHNNHQLLIQNIIIILMLTKLQQQCAYTNSSTYSCSFIVRIMIVAAPVVMRRRRCSYPVRGPASRRTVIAATIRSTHPLTCRRRRCLQRLRRRTGRTSRRNSRTFRICPRSQVSCAWLSAKK